MKSSDRSILIGLAILGLIAAFWFLLLAPKRDRATELEGRIADLKTAVETQEQLAAAGEAAKAEFGPNYRSLVSLGKAVPEGSDTSSLFVQLNALAKRSGAHLKIIELKQGSAAPAPASGPEQTTVDGAEGGEGEGSEGTEGDSPETTTVSTTPAPATETAAATLPLGATVGAAGLPVMPYSLELSGTYFELADFLAGLDELVGMRKGKPSVDGRLLTVDGFSISAENQVGQPGVKDLDVNVLVTSYVSPADQGLTAGATPSGPAPAPSTTTTAGGSSSAPTPTATVAP